MTHQPMGFFVRNLVTSGPTLAKKKITIEDLATTTYKGFKGVDERFDKVDRQPKFCDCSRI